MTTICVCGLPLVELLSANLHSASSHLAFCKQAHTHTHTHTSAHTLLLNTLSCYFNAVPLRM